MKVLMLFLQNCKLRYIEYKTKEEYMYVDVTINGRRNRDGRLR